MRRHKQSPTGQRTHSTYPPRPGRGLGHLQANTSMPGGRTSNMCSQAPPEDSKGWGEYRGVARVPAPAHSMSVSCWEGCGSCGGPDLQPWLEKEKAASFCNLQGPGRKAGAAPAAVGPCGSLSLILLPEAPGSSSPNIYARTHARAWSCETARSALVHPVSCFPGKIA